MKIGLRLFLASWLGVTPAIAQTLSDAELESIRGGYIGINGMSFSLGAVMKSYVDGSVALESTMTMDATGLATTQQLGPAAQPLTAQAAASIALPVVPGAAIVPGDGGVTAFLHTLGSDQITNMVVNTASGRLIQQTTDVTVTIPNLTALQQQLALAGFATRLHDMVGTGLIAAAPH
jgi:hypothetical protein